MQGESGEVVESYGCEAIVGEPERMRMLWLMAEYYRTLGCTDVKARLPGFVPPPVLSGTLEDHRPDCTCRQADSAKTPIILEVVTAEGVGDERSDNRWTLLSSAAKLYSAELHFVVPKFHPQAPVEQLLRRRLSRLDLQANHIWAV